MSVFWLGGPEGVIVPSEELKTTEEDRYFMPGVIHGSEDYIIQVYYWSNGEGPENDRIGAKYLWAASVLDWAKEATNEDGSLNKEIFEELINENAEEFVIDNDGTGDFVTLNEEWDKALALDYQEVISWAQKQISKNYVEPENTEINYLYRDASNYKVYNSVIVVGKITEEQKKRIMDALHDGEYFIPAKVGLPANRFETVTEDDHYWFEFQEFESTTAEPTIDLTVSELADAFSKCKNRWEEGIDMYGNLLPSKTNMKAINIEWDIDSADEYDEVVELPYEIEIPKGMTDEDEISDYITDVTGFCHKGFELVNLVNKVEKEKKPGLDALISTAEKRAQAVSDNEVTQTEPER